MKIILMIKLISKIFGNKKPKPAPLKELTPEEFEDAKLKSRVAFVDDEEIPHVERLRQDGYNIVHFSDINNIDDFSRKKYHVVILDIQGVGQEISPNSEGWGILKYLKKNCPNIVVIMFTGAEWSMTKYRDEANIADDFIGKDLEFLDFKSKLDEGIRKAFSPKYHFEVEKKKMQLEISNTSTIEQIKEVIDTYGADKESAILEVKKLNNNPKILESVNNVLSIADSIRKLLT